MYLSAPVVGPHREKGTLTMDGPKRSRRDKQRLEKFAQQAIEPASAEMATSQNPFSPSVHLDEGFAAVCDHNGSEAHPPWTLAVFTATTDGGWVVRPGSSFGIGDNRLPVNEDAPDGGRRYVQSCGGKGCATTFKHNDAWITDVMANVHANAAGTIHVVPKRFWV